MATVDLIPGLVSELAATIEAVGGVPVTVSSLPDLTEEGWAVPLTASGALSGAVLLALDDPGVAALLHLVLGSDADAGEAGVRDLLKELVTQAASALCLKASWSGLALSLGPIARVERVTHHAGESSGFALAMGDATLRVTGSASVEAVAQTPALASTSASSSVPKPATRTGHTTAVPTNNLEVVLDIELPLSVRFGTTVMSIRALSALGPGSIVDMGRSPDDPVEILVCGRPIATAEVVIVAGNYGVRIADLISPAERLRAMEGQL